MRTFKLFIKIFLIFILVPAGVFGSVYILDQNGFFNITKINLTLNIQSGQKNFAKPYADDLYQQLQTFKGQSLFRFSLSSVAQKVKLQQWIKDFRVSRSWPSQLDIEIEPQIVSLLYTDQNKLTEGRVLPVTEQGQLLNEIETSQAPAVSLLKGEVFLKDEGKRKKAIELLKSLPQEGKLSHKIISEIGFDSKDGYWVEVIKNNMKIKLGEDQFAVKSARVSQVLDYLEKRDLKARVIDANLSKKVLVRLQQTP